MAAATVNLRVQPYRLMNKRDAAHYCGLSSKTFERACPVPPVRLANGDLRWDVHDLDAHIESLKAADSAADDIVSLLA